MKIIKELDIGHHKKLKHYFLQGRNGKYYKLLLFRLYDIDVPEEFPKFEVNLQEVNEDGTFIELKVPYFRRFLTREDAMAHLQEILDNFDEFLGLQEQKHKSGK